MGDSFAQLTCICLMLIYSIFFGLMAIALGVVMGSGLIVTSGLLLITFFVCFENYRLRHMLFDVDVFEALYDYWEYLKEGAVYKKFEEICVSVLTKLKLVYSRCIDKIENSRLYIYIINSDNKLTPSECMSLFMLFGMFMSLVYLLVTTPLLLGIMVKGPTYYLFSVASVLLGIIAVSALVDKVRFEFCDYSNSMLNTMVPYDITELLNFRGIFSRENWMDFVGRKWR